MELSSPMELVAEPNSLERPSRLWLGKFLVPPIPLDLLEQCLSRLGLPPLGVPSKAPWLVGQDLTCQQAVHLLDPWQFTWTPRWIHGTALETNLGCSFTNTVMLGNFFSRYFKGEVS